MVDLLKNILPSTCRGPVFVHSDLRFIVESLGIDFRKAILEIGENNLLLDRAIEQLQRITGDRELWVPAFNYDFCNTRIFDVKKDPAQIGVLAEYFRSKISNWRTPTPVFSTCGTGKKPDIGFEYEVDPFDIGSEFHDIFIRDGSFLFFGVAFSPTFTHYIERITGIGPLYRYDKKFSGIVKDGDEVRDVCLNYHVIPKGHVLKYDMKRLFQDLIDHKLIRSLPSTYRNSYIISAKDLTEHWQTHLQRDPFFLLDDISRKHFESLVSSKGGRLEIDDFEAMN